MSVSSAKKQNTSRAMKWFMSGRRLSAAQSGFSRSSSTYSLFNRPVARTSMGLPVAYNRAPRSDWAPFASLVLEASYEATVLAAVLNHQQTGNPRVYLTMVGGGAFGNETRWIFQALRRALHGVRHYPLDVAVVCYRQVSQDLVDLLAEISAGF
jgi:hypothetical protein